MAASRSESVIVQRHFDVLLNAAAVFQAEANIVCPVRMAMRGGAPIELGGEQKISVSANTALNANTKTVLRCRVCLISSHAIVFRRPIQISDNNVLLAPNQSKRLALSADKVHNDVEQQQLLDRQQV
jgi:hypothetical protein